jgi:glycosyltransferase involved in cell wall biosynthesis
VGTRSRQATKTSAGRQRVVFLNWRDSKHPQAGGAELYCESVARRLARDGAQVTLLTAHVKDEPRDEVVEGVCVRRRGGRFSVYIRALLWLLINRSKVDAIIDCQNGIPFFSPVVARAGVPVVCIVFHVHQDQFDLYFPWPMNRIGRWLEGPMARRVYGYRPVAAISPSTRAEIRRRLRLRGRVYVVPCGMDAIPQPVDDFRASEAPRIVCVGRLVPHKQLDRLLDAIPEVRAAVPDVVVDIAGSGPEAENLKAQARQLGLESIVHFHGRVDDATRDKLLSQGSLTVNPSVGEGWGLSVIEANQFGLPAVAFRVPGLQDAVVPGETGWLAEPGEPLAPTIVEALGALSDPETAAGWRRRARAWAARFDWEATALRLAALLEDERERLSRNRERETRDQRRRSDLACRIDLPHTDEALSGLRSISRATDVWTVDADRIVALLHGADEDGVKVALGRLGIRGGAEVRPARPVDWLIGGRPLFGVGLAADAG